MVLCGHDAASKKVAADLARRLDFEPVDEEPLRSARYLDAVTML